MTRIRSGIRRHSFIAVMMGVIACGRSEPVRHDLPAGVDSVFAGAVSPGARYLGAQTELLERAQTLIQAGATSTSRIAVFDSSESFNVVLDAYAAMFDVRRVADNPHNDLSAVPPVAMRFRGEVSADVDKIRPLLKTLGKVHGPVPVTPYEAATFRPLNGRPRVSLQRPYFDLVEGRIVDRTLILLVTE